ncbi:MULTISPECIES: diacylglycerol kinase family protein [Streptomyces]|uniref:diacylglycerol kinase n=1 Tax=Streptomyces TaxID=1883 RepID=UPI00093F217B|nr:MULTISPECIES: diacylglycerol kinase [unclassified Streptomyces]OKJ14717.1 diacylglycerol kinase [Streptomyces sp. TSRI0261]QNQ35094.1 diacylglycerol kinase [Streptomyces sp. CB00271]
MSAAEPPGDGDDQLLVVIDPAARRTDGESVRIAKDVLSAGSHAKICLPDTPEEFARALSRRGSRRPVVVGDDHALLRAVAQLHRERELAAGVLSLIPVGAAHALEVAHALGVPRGAVAAARTALDGAVRRLDLLVDDSDGVVLGRLRIPAPAPPSGSGGPHTGVTAVWDTCRSLMTSLVRPAPVAATTHPGTHRLRIEADGVLLSDLDTPVRGISVTSQGGGGLADVVVRTASGEAVTAEAKAVTVSGADFRYRADIQTGGPVRTRTWTVRAGAWGLMLPSPASADGTAGARW